MPETTVENRTAPRLLASSTFWVVLRGAFAAAAVWIFVTAWGRWGVSEVQVADPLMYTNAGNLLFWVVWMMGLILLVPMIGRAWCGVCPLGTLNEMCSRWGMSRPFPRILRNSYLMGAALVGTVLLIGLGRIHHFPAATAYYLGSWAALAVVMGVIYAGRSLCSYACPVGGMLALYGRVAPLVMGVRERETCLLCTGRECVKGRERWLQVALARLRSAVRIRRHPCPVNLRVWEMEGSQRCLFCFNCLRACPLDNVKLFLRAPVSSIWKERYPRVSETAMAAAVMGFLLLSYSRFWPALESAVALPITGLASLTGPYLARPLYLIWVGFVLPFVILLAPSVFAFWGEAFSRETSPEEEPGGTAVGGYLPIRLWLSGKHAGGSEESEEDGEERFVEGKDSLLGLAAALTPALVPLFLGGHLALALVKLNAKLSYLPLAAADPSGVKTYMAVEELGLLPRPGLILSLPAIRMAAAVVLAGGVGLSILSVLKIAGKEGVPSLPFLLQIGVIGACFAGGLINWLF